MSHSPLTLTSSSFREGVCWRFNSTRKWWKKETGLKHKFVVWGVEDGVLSITFSPVPMNGNVATVYRDPVTGYPNHVTMPDMPLNKAAVPEGREMRNIPLPLAQVVYGKAGRTTLLFYLPPLLLEELPATSQEVEESLETLASTPQDS